MKICVKIVESLGKSKINNPQVDTNENYFR